MSVKGENEWIETRFDCNITKPFITEKEIELLEQGFKVKKDIPKDHVPLDKNHVDKIIEQFS